MGWLKGLVSARWFLPVFIGVVAVVAGATGYGYLKGYSAAESHYLEQMNKALARQMKQLLAIKEQEIKLALEGEKEKNNVVYKVRTVIKPNTSCELPVECVQWYDNILRATTPD